VCARRPHPEPFGGSSFDPPLAPSVPVPQ
jgi:hypothetical protein